MDSSAVWDSQDPLSISSHDDFQFLDMGNMGINSLGEGLQFDFQEFSNQQSQGGQLMQQNGGSLGGQDTTMQEHMPSITSTSSHPTIPGTAMSVHAPNSDSILDLDAQIQYLQHQRNRQQERQRQMQEQQQNYYAHNHVIPPTPNSIEMHSGSYRQYPPNSNAQQQQAIYERYQLQLKDSEVSYYICLFAVLN